MTDIGVNACIYCSKQITKNQKIRGIMCTQCMAYIVTKLSIPSNEDNPDFIDFTVDAKGRLSRGDDIKSIFNNIPEGYEEWLKNNPFTKGFGVTSD
jgi:DNA-directed RNA polymerase subunit RPC12/RpoP